jgi:bacillithiol system protein YtxJ
MINWIPLESESQLMSVIDGSTSQIALIFKHSTRCSISSMAKSRLEKAWSFTADEIKPYYLDLLAYRQISSVIAEKLNVYHESPQVLLVKNGECIYDASHLDISLEEIRDVLSENINSVS